MHAASHITASTDGTYTAEVDCAACEGAGELVRGPYARTCPVCSGSGRADVTYIRCTACNGRDDDECYACSGYGHELVDYPDDPDDGTDVYGADWERMLAGCLSELAYPAS